MVEEVRSLCSLLILCRIVEDRMVGRPTWEKRVSFRRRPCSKKGTALEMSVLVASWVEERAQDGWSVLVTMGLNCAVIM